MKYVVGVYLEHLNAHQCKDELGNKAFMDLRLRTKLKDVNPISLVGKTVEIQNRCVYCYIALDAEYAEQKGEQDAAASSKPAEATG